MGWERRPFQGGLLAATRGARTVTALGHAAVDRAVIVLAKASRPRPSAAAASRIEAETLAALSMFGARGWLDRPESYHLTPPPMREPEVARTHVPGLPALERIRFDSGYQPHPGEPGRDRWLACEANRTAGALVLRHRGPGRWLVCMHGAGMGTPATDLAAFDVTWLHRRLGLNVAIPVLPRHGPRRSGHRPMVEFPTEDVLDNVHGLAQAAWDVRRLLDWIRAQGATRIGMQGLSLGGYVAALCAAFEPDLDCVLACIPAADWPALFREHYPPTDPLSVTMTSEASQRVHVVVSPLALEPRVPRERRVIVAGAQDRLVNRVHQVDALWERWGRPDLHWHPASHLGFLASRSRRTILAELLARFDLVDSQDGVPCNV
jgi:pimeloyl-ACP methyl ester carboxylesterase